MATYMMVVLIATSHDRRLKCDDKKVKRGDY